MVVIPKAWKKSITWNLLAFTITVAVAYIITREVQISARVGIIERCLKLVAYPMHERYYAKKAEGEKQL